MKPTQAITKVRTLRTASNNARESIGFIAQQCSSTAMKARRRSRSAAS